MEEKIQEEIRKLKEIKKTGEDLCHSRLRDEEYIDAMEVVAELQGVDFIITYLEELIKEGGK